MFNLISRDSGTYPHFLEQRFPHILQRMVALWGTAGIEGYLNGLLAPVGPGAAGFPEEALTEIRAIKVICCGEDQVVEAPQQVDTVSLRKALLNFLDEDNEIYPKTLEAQFPHVLKEIVSRLGNTQTDDYFANLLTVRKQTEYGFSEDVLVEIFTIRAFHRAKYPNRDNQISQNTDRAESPGSQTRTIEEHHDASMVFDRIHRW